MKIKFKKLMSVGLLGVMMCCGAFVHAVPPKIKKFSKEEDNMIIKLVEQQQAAKWPQLNWVLIADDLNKKFHANDDVQRSPLVCMDRYRRYLKPDVNLAPWTQDEDKTLVERYAYLGPKWADIAKSLPGRTAHAVRNRWRLLKKHAVDVGNKKVGYGVPAPEVLDMARAALGVPGDGKGVGVPADGPAGVVTDGKDTPVTGGGAENRGDLFDCLDGEEFDWGLSPNE